MEMTAAATTHATGCAHYDSVRFSAPHSADVGRHGRSGLWAVRHIGLRGEGSARSTACKADVHTIVANLGAGGHYEGRFAGKAVARPIRHGDMTFVPAGMDADIQFPASFSAAVLYIPSGMFGSLGTAGTFESRAFHSLLDPVTSGLVMGLWRGTFGDGDAVAMESGVAALGEALARADGAKALADERIRITRARLARVRALVEERLADEIGLADMAEAAALSPFHFARVFKAATGETPYHYLLDRRLARARDLLRTTELPILAVARACGFAGQAHFTTMFGHRIGVTPARYRRAMRG
jgi:AraC family transcriptional regulator